MTRVEFDAIANRVWSRERGEIDKEIGQVQVSLEIYSESIGKSADALADREFQRVLGISREEWRRRQNEKAAIGIALPAAED